jgi:hypothetical protein
MSFTQRPDFPILREMLLLEGFDDSGENVVAGMRQVLGDITTGWRSAYNDIEREHKRATKKLAPEQFRKISSAANRVIDTLLNDVRVTPDVSTLMDTLRSKDEVKAAYTTFSVLSAGAAEIHTQFMYDAVEADIFDRAEGDKMIDDVKKGTFKNVGPNVVKFVTDHKEFLKRVLVMDEASSAFRIDAGAQLLSSKLAATKTEQGQPGQKDAVLGVFYMLLMIRRQLATVAQNIKNEASRKKLPDVAPAGKTKPAAQPPKPPVTPAP